MDTDAALENISAPAMSRCQTNAPSPMDLPNELIAEILSYLAVKPLMRLKSLSKSWNTLISDPAFEKTHLKRSARNPHLVLTCKHSHDLNNTDYCIVVPFSLCRLLENPCTTITYDACYQWNKKVFHWKVVDSCNGLLCLRGYSISAYRDYWLCFWNPATRKKSKKFGPFCDFSDLSDLVEFAFGYDNSTGTYKVVAFQAGPDEDHDGEASGKRKSDVRVFSLGDKIWRNIQSFPEIPLEPIEDNDSAYLSGTINWLALRCNNIDLVIVSLDLSTETYSELLLPRGFDEFILVDPAIGVLNDCLCYYHDLNKNGFVIWQMKEFGVQASWTQLLKISYQSLPIMHYIEIDEIDEIDDLVHPLIVPWLPLCLFENGDTLILASLEQKAILYSTRDNRVKTINITNQMRWYNQIFWYDATNYVESLVSIPL